MNANFLDVTEVANTVAALHRRGYPDAADVLHISPSGLLYRHVVIRERYGPMFQKSGRQWQWGELTDEGRRLVRLATI